MPYRDPAVQREYQRRLSRKRRAAAKAQAAALGIDTLTASALPRSATSSSRPVHQVTQGVLRTLLERHGLTLHRLITKIVEMLECQRVLSTKSGPIKCPDNDAQLRAVDLARGLVEQAGWLPGPDHAPHGGIQVNLVIKMPTPRDPKPQVVEIAGQS